MIDWNDGRLITLTAGETARCDNLSPGELYALLFYNTAAIDADAPVTLVWSDTVQPVTMIVPGTAPDSGPASFAFISGDDSRRVSASLPTHAASAEVSTFVVSVSMPLDPAGLTDRKLPADGEAHPFRKLCRYHAVPPTGWSSRVLTSPATQFISVQMQKTRAQIIVLNDAAGLRSEPVKLGPVANQTGVVAVRNVHRQYDEEWIPGDGAAWVWMNADSPQNSLDATISLQLLSRLARWLGGIRGARTVWPGEP